MWQILTAQIRKEIYYLRVCRGLSQRAEKMPQRTRGTGDLLYIDQHILKKSKQRRENVAKRKLTRKKAYDMVLRYWIVDCMKMYKISDKVINFIAKAGKNEKLELTIEGKTLPEVKIQKTPYMEILFCPYYLQ